MKRYFALFFAFLIGTVNAQGFESCGYIPKQTQQRQFPEWEMFEHCASYINGVLKISRKHLANLNFNRETNNASFFTSGQYFYVKPDGKFLPVIFYDNGADYYQEGLTRSLLNGKIAYFNTDLELVLAPGYDWGWPFHEGRALVCNGCILAPVEDGHQALQGGWWGYINREGKEVVPVRYKASEVPRQ
jgi:hypothetical protein